MWVREEIKGGAVVEGRTYEGKGFGVLGKKMGKDVCLRMCVCLGIGGKGVCLEHGERWEFFFREWGRLGA